MTGTLIRRERDLETLTEGRSPYEDRSRAWIDAATCQGAARISGNHQKVGRGKKRSFLRAFRALLFP